MIEINTTLKTLPKAVWREGIIKFRHVMNHEREWICDLAYCRVHGALSDYNDMALTRFNRLPQAVERFVQKVLAERRKGGNP